jgi:hypothetical protein
MARGGTHGGGRKSVARSRQGTPARMSKSTGGVGRLGGGHGGRGYRGFKSRAQWRWAWATHQSFARKKSHETAGGPKVRYRRLPERKSIATSKTGRKA